MIEAPSTNPYLREFGVTVASLEARGLVGFAEATELEIAERGTDGREHRLVPEAGAAWRRLKAAADQDGEMISIVSAFRGIERQAEIVRAKLARGESIERILSVSAFPGFSEHHTGRAVDVGTPGVRPLETEFAETSAFHWLSNHAGRFGFTLSYPEGNAQGYAFEPWHWCYHVDD